MSAPTDIEVPARTLLRRRRRKPLPDVLRDITDLVRVVDVAEHGHDVDLLRHDGLLLDAVGLVLGLRLLPCGALVFTRLDHFLVMTHDVDGTRDFYRDVLGFSEGFRPDLGFLGHWLYLGDMAAIHIAEWESYTAHSRRLGIPVTVPAPGTGVLDHVAFNAPGVQHAVLEQRLRARGLAFHPHDTPDIGLRQIFLEDPNGLKLELNFWQR